MLGELNEWSGRNKQLHGLIRLISGVQAGPTTSRRQVWARLCLVTLEVCKGLQNNHLGVFGRIAQLVRARP